MNRTNKYWEKMQEGFTLIEILIVVIIIGILAAIAVPTYLNYVKRGYASDAKVAISAIVNASEVYFNEQGEIPPGTDDLKQSGYLDLKRSTERNWDFELNLSEDAVYGLSGDITGASTESMKGGAGNTLVYSLESGRFSGYGESTKE